MTFVFSALLEYALVNYALRADRSYLMRKAALRRRMSDMQSLDDDDDCAGFLFARDADAEMQATSNGHHNGHKSTNHEHQNNHVTQRRSYIQEEPTNLLLVRIKFL